MKRIIFGILAMGIAFAGCRKTDHGDEFHCFGTDKNCNLDTFIQWQPQIILSDSCSFMDGVNVRNFNAAHQIKLGDSVAIRCDAIGLNSGVTGKVIFASAYDEYFVDIKTFAEYNTCAASAEVLTNIDCLYRFKPNKDGHYTFSFANVYGGKYVVEVDVLK